jgi:hypothetical protein
VKQDLKIVTVNRKSLGVFEKSLEAIAKKTAKKLASLFNKTHGMKMLGLLKFEEIGNDPLIANSPLNFVEQLNQTFTYLASIRASRHIFDTEQRVKKITMHLGSSKGSDLVMKNGIGKTLGLAEVFAAVDHTNNGKLKKDIEKVDRDAKREGVSIKRVYFISPKEKEFVIKDTDQRMKKSRGGELWTANRVFVKRFLPEV